MKINEAVLDSYSRIPGAGQCIGSVGVGIHLAKLIKHVAQYAKNGLQMGVAKGRYQSIVSGDVSVKSKIVLKTFKKYGNCDKRIISYMENYQVARRENKELSKPIHDDLKGIEHNLYRFSWIGAFILHHNNKGRES